jgi:toluene monooxygenase system protein E
MAVQTRMSRQRTYWHLEGVGRVPSDYDIASTALLYHPGRGFEVETPGARWYRRYQQGWWSCLGGCERFRDPRETTYTRYTALQTTQEAYVDGLLRSIEEMRYDQQLPRAWLTQLEDWLPVLRYPCHGLQMLAGYIGQMAPTSRVVIAYCFQTGDEMRRVQRFAYRMRQLQDTQRGFGAESRNVWQHAAPWQPLRALIERLLVTYDPGEAFVALNLVLKPMFDQLFMFEFAQLAEASQDPLFGRILSSLGDDCLWHRNWSRSLVSAAIEGAPDLADTLRDCRARWYEPVCEALGALQPLWSSEVRPWSEVQAALHADSARFWESAGLRTGGPP